MKRIGALLLAVWLTLCLTLSGCGDDGTGRGFRFPLGAEPNGLDPQTATDTAAITVISALFEGLTRLDDNGAVVEGIATHTLSEDGKTYTFTLKESYWSTIKIRGEETPWDSPAPVTADDFLFAFQRAVDPATGSPVAVEFDGIKNAKAIRTGKKKVSSLGVKAVDDTTLIITLEKADPNFLTKLAGTPFMPCRRDFFESTGGRYGLEQKYLLSNGAFWLAAWNHNESLLMYKNEHHYDAANVAPEAVRYVIGTEDSAEALKIGDLDVAELTVAQKDALGNSANYALLQDTVRCLWFNTSVDPFTVADVRRALRDSVEWSALQGQFTGDETPAEGFVPPDATVGGETYRTEGNALPYRTDAKSAKQALKKGLTTLEKDYLPRFEILAADDPVSADVARYLVQSWQKNLGVYPTLTLLPEADLNRRVKSGNYQAAIATYAPTGLSGAENLSCYATDAVGNLSRLNNKTVNAAINKALTGGRKELTALEQTLWNVCPCVPLSYPTRYYAIRNKEKAVGITIRPFGGGRWSAPLEFRQAKKYD